MTRHGLTSKLGVWGVAGLLGVVGAAASASAQEIRLPEIPSQKVAVSFDSGEIASTGRTEVAFTDSVVVRDASWMRLFFDQVDLGVTPEGESAKLRITSMLDGAVQVLDRDGIAAWQNTSAVFNGDWLVIEVIQPAGATPSRVVVGEANTGAPDAEMAAIANGRSICGSTDDRMLSNDPRSGRVWPIGCTAWLVNDCAKCMLTAGHCGPSSTSVIQFNVPLSTPSGTPVAPPPEDQYPVDPASIQSNGGQGVGNDWSYFGTLENTSTQLTAYEAQGEVAYELGEADAATTTIRITGFGSTSFPVDPTWYLAQKTHTGPFVGVFGSSLQYQPDTSGGNSGSAVVDDGTGFAVGIHTHAGCNLSTGQGNQGTDIRFASVQNALDNPQGICAAGGSPFDLISVIPDYLTSGVSSFDVQAAEACGVVPDVPTARMLLDRGNGIEEISGTDDGNGGVTFDTPDLDCGTAVSIAFEIDGTSGDTFRIPNSGFFDRTVIDSLNTFANEDFEQNAGFADASSTSLNSGAWERGVPAGGGNRNDPAVDADGSGSAWLTENAPGDTDVDGGPAILLSPAYDLSQSNAPQMQFALWVNTDDAGDDPITVEFSSDNGSSWVVVETLTSSTLGWETKSYDVASFVDLTDQFRLRVTATDSPNNSILEVGFDALRIDSVVCNDVPCDGDVDGNGSVGLDDLLTVLGEFGGAGAGDIDNDGVVGLPDLLTVLGAFGDDC